ncbi:uroporphyrinogen-III C-methyltransferase [Amphibiibacter pelophylacis]|uniref:Uroporphyrinogen-III C-methyltransferase n=1 Tax=Amphibiibacter pelophylacis TaxID=1799477 RepID=A0ACC6P4I8_9BURK
MNAVDALIDSLPPAPANPGGQPGRVTLAGAGPGDPDLLTVKAARAITQAQTVLYDALVSEQVLDLLPQSAQRVFVGKRASRHSLPQDDICTLMVRLAQRGQPLLRLKGGDPYIFGRGGEEVQALAAAGIPYEVIPGISAAQTAAASTGMALTHRDHAQMLVLATGHLRHSSESGHPPHLDLDWPALVRPGQTVVIYMGVGALPELCRQLIAHGLPPTHPAAIVESASLPGERCTPGTLATLPGLALAAGVKPPAIILVGDVVGLGRVGNDPVR